MFREVFSDRIFFEIFPPNFPLCRQIAGSKDRPSISTKMYIFTSHCSKAMITSIESYCGAQFIIFNQCITINLILCNLIYDGARRYVYECVPLLKNLAGFRSLPILNRKIMMMMRIAGLTGREAKATPFSLSSSST